MKRFDLVQAIEALGCVLIRHGGKHDWYTNPRLASHNLCPVTEKLGNG
jgi:hypothetical protein